MKKEAWDFRKKKIELKRILYRRILSLRNLSPQIKIIQRAQGFQGELRDKVNLSLNVYSRHSVS